MRVWRGIEAFFDVPPDGRVVALAVAVLELLAVLDGAEDLVLKASPGAARVGDAAAGAGAVASLADLVERAGDGGGGEEGEDGEELHCVGDLKRCCFGMKVRSATKDVGDYGRVE